MGKKSNIRICRTCGKKFDVRLKKRLRGGFIDECPTCSRSDRSTMYLGRMGEKCEFIDVFRNPDQVRSQLQYEAGGFRPQVRISNIERAHVKSEED